MKRLLIFILILSPILAFNGCQSPEPEQELSIAGKLMESNFLVRHTTEHNTLYELLDNCGTQSIKEAMEKFPTDYFTKLSYFTTYYIWDNDFNFPTSVIAFEYGGATFYYSGAEEHNPFAAYLSGSVFGGNGIATLINEKEGNNITTGILEYFSYPDEFALSPENPIDAVLYYDALVKITGAEFRCIRNDVVSVIDNTVYISYGSHYMNEAKYTLSEPDVLNEISCSFSPSEQEFVNYSSDPAAPGGDMVQSPAYLSIRFETAGIGRTVLNILGDDNSILYSVEIAVDEEFGAFLPDEAF